MKLNLGCGEKHKEGFVNIDIQEPCDLKHDLRTPLPYADGAIDEIYSADAIYKLSRKEWRELKKELARVLKEGGKLEIIVYDFLYILQAFLNNTDGRRWDWWWQTIFGAQSDEFDFKKNGFSYENLRADLWEEGFIDFHSQHEQPELLHLICYKQKLP